jgi:NAD(P)-dependent dehydrogenase (short-subunit alcohol dehydrogenase family)
MHLLREPILASHSRVVFISSGAIRMVEETGRSISGPRFCILIIHTDSLRPTLLANSGKGPEVTYPTSKFVQLLAVHHWRRALGDQATVVCVSPGMIPGTGLGRNVDSGIPEDHPDAKDVPTG